MARQRAYETNAQRQAAYRERKRSRPVSNRIFYQALVGTGGRVHLPPRGEQVEFDPRGFSPPLPADVLAACDQFPEFKRAV